MRVFIIVFLYCSLYAYDYDKALWNKVIYFSDNQPEIESANFYLSTKNDFTAEDELSTTVDLLRSSKYGKMTACAYPLRYTFIKSQNISIPTYDLSSCNDLEDFTVNFKKNNLYLAFSSEYISVPSSAFGHIMIVLKKKDVSFEIANTIHFAATTNNNDGFFKYNWKGLTGGYQGYYVLDVFFKKLYEYNTKEQRNIYLYKLDFSDEQIKKIIYALYELRKATFKYYFFNKNCAIYTTQLLNISSDKLLNEKFFYLPLDTLQEYKNNIVERKVFLSLINKIDYLYNALSKEDKTKFEEIIRKNTIVDNSLHNDLKLLLINYYQFQFRKFHTSYKNYNSVMDLNYEDILIENNSLNPIDKKASYIGITYIQNEENDKSLLLSYRPLYSDIHDFKYNNLQNTEFSVFKTVLKLEDKSLSIEQFDIMSMKSYAKRSVYYKPLSWQLYSGFNKENNDENLKFTNEIGLGVTQQVFNNINISLLGNVGLSNITPFIGGEVYISKNFRRDIKFEINSYYNLFFQKDDFYKNTLTLLYKKMNFIYSINYENSSLENSINFGIKYYF